MNPSSVILVEVLETGLYGFVGLIDGSLEEVEGDECLSTSKTIKLITETINFTKKN